MNLRSILNLCKSRKMVVFGTGSLAQRVINELSEFKIAYVVDNNAEKWGTSFAGVSVKNPEVLKQEKRAEVIVLIASSWVTEISLQLEAMGFVAVEDTIDCNYLTYTAAGEYYSPLPDIDELKTKEATLFTASKNQVTGIHLNETGQLQLVEQLAKHQPLFPYMTEASSTGLWYPPITQYNGFFSYEDAMNLFCMLNEFKPKRLIEIGSGFSSALMLDTNEHFLDNEVKLTFIEPYPERLNTLIRAKDRTNVTIYEEMLQHVSLDIFKQLEANDILFIDSSHVVKIDSDVNLIFSEILPLLNEGVIVHFHDIFYPFEYPKSWIYEGRAWNEAYMLRSFLQYNNAFSIMLWNNYLGMHHQAKLDALFPHCRAGASIWLQKKTQQ